MTTVQPMDEGAMTPGPPNGHAAIGFDVGIFRTYLEALLQPGELQRRKYLNFANV